MISNNAPREVGVNSSSTAEFSIKNSAKMFNMVISGLYSDKPQSITREIWSNAFDAHCMTGKADVPFVVTLPTALMTTFKCRDFGPGIHHSDMEGFYTVLGHSTKEGTNDAVGKWGVGRMSPMSYTDSFTVVSRHKGMVAYYSVQLGPDGAPRLHTLAPPTATDEPSGLEISFPVQRKDLSLFEAAAKRVSLGFDVKPVVEGQPDYKWPVIERTFEGYGWSLVSRDTRELEGGTVYAKMGCVLYPVPRDIVRSSYGTTLVLEFDIGQLEVTASREGLSFGRNEPTKDAILEAYKMYKDSVLEVFLKRVKDAPTYLDALYVTRRRPADVRVVDDLTWKGEELHTSKLFPILPNDGYTLARHDSYDMHRKNSSLSFPHVGGIVRSDKDFCVYISGVIGPNRDVRAGSRILADYKSKKRDTTLYWFKVGSVAEGKALESKLVARMGTDIPITFVSDLADTGPVTSTRSVTQIKKKLAGSHSWDDHTMDDAEFTAGGVYLPISNNQPLDGQEKYRTVTSMLYSAGKLKSPDLIVVPKTHWKKFEDATQWKPLWEVAEAFTLKDYDKKVSWATEHLRYNADGTRFSCLNTSCPKLKALKSYIGVDPSKTVWGLTSSQMYSFLKTMGKSLPTEDGTFIARFSAVLSDYPLLVMMGRNSLKTSDFENYVEGILSLRNQVNTKSIAA
jgi:hypothetical protein